MKILAVDTSANTASAAIACDGQLVAEQIINYKKTHSETLMPMIDGLLAACGTDIGEIDVFAAANGPGSFTGLRIGVSTVKALAHAAGKPAVGISTLEALAYNIPCADGLISPIMDARRQQVYNAVYRADGGVLTEVTAPRALAIIDCIREFENEKRVCFLGDGVLTYRDIIVREMGERAVFAPLNCALQRASSVAALARIKAERGELGDCHTLLPFYIRKPQAEREYEEKMNNKGES